MTDGTVHRRAVRHTGWNLAGVLLPFAVGLLAIPVLTRAIGPARFGILGLAWMLLEYFSLFDAGLGRATIRAVAAERATLLEAGRSAREGAAARALSATVTAAVAVQVFLGALAALAFAAASPLVVARLLRVPPELAAEALTSLRILAATVPVLMLGLALRGLLEAAERFDLSNAIRIPMSAGTFVVPAALAVAGHGLPAMLAALLLLRVVTVVAQAVALRRALPALSWRWRGERQRLRELLVFGGWVAVSNVVSPVLVYLDRLIVGVLLGVTALGYYTAPFEASLRLLVLPAALVTTLYPMASALIGSGDTGRMRRLYAGSVRALALVMVPVAAVGIVLAPELLTAWLGAPYAAQGALPLRILCVGVLVNSIVHVPFAFLQAAGRPDIMARFHVAELVVYVPLALLLVSRFGIAGAASAWSLRAAVDGVLVFAAARRVLGVSAGGVADGRSLRAAALVALLLLLLQSLRLAVGQGRELVLIAGVLPLLGAYAALAWRWLLTGPERAAVAGIPRWRRARAGRIAPSADSPDRPAPTADPNAGGSALSPDEPLARGAP